MINWITRIAEASTLLALSLCVFERCKRGLHMLQLDSYSNTRFLTWVVRGPSERLLDSAQLYPQLGLLAAQSAIVLLNWGAAPIAIGFIIWAGVATAIWARRAPFVAKKPLVYTSRAIRILALSIAVAVAGVAFTLRLTANPILISLVSLISLQLCPLAVVAANLLLVPVQYSINAAYVARAARKRRAFKGRVIGVAGSFGKTSTKYFIDAILSSKYNVLKTPESYNTLLGVCRVINNSLNEAHQFFVVEMGAYRRGDVAEIARLVRPDLGVLTAIGPEHFERFKSLDNIMATNFELIEALPSGAAAAFNCENEYGQRLANAAGSKRVLRYSLRQLPDSTLWADEIEMGPEGTAFTMVHPDGQRVRAKAKILGMRNIENILGAACIGLEAGLKLPEIADAIPRIEAVAHRLQIIRPASGVTIIDDAYNSNPSGAAEALEVLKRFPSGKKVVVTPGMVELGALEEQENGRFGAHAADVCDFIILVGQKQTESVAKGVRSRNFPASQLRIVKNLTEAQDVLGTFIRSGDTILFENDLPDLYDE
jgi:UDP-N-acetylmuramoyl-tripeptide--D-alanyl-D-alanine ligase